MTVAGRRFTRRIENFVCAACGHPVTGNGYTNHCPLCLSSLHVDNHPGDRACPCRGLMEPVGLEMRDGAPVIVHRCTRCGALKRNRAGEADDSERLARLSAGALRLRRPR